MPDLSKYLQRLSWLMRQGTPQNDVALYLPNADAYSHFTAGRVHLIEAERELVGEKIMPAIFEAATIWISLTTRYSEPSVKSTRELSVWVPAGIVLFFCRELSESPSHRFASSMASLKKAAF